MPRASLLPFLLLPVLLQAGPASADPANLRRSMALLDWKSHEARASGGATAPRAAGEGVSEEAAAFRRLDLNGDGKVSKAEAAGDAHSTLGFDRADRNKDGLLTLKEYESIRKRLERLKAREAKRLAAARGASASSGATAKKP